MANKAEQAIREPRDLASAELEAKETGVLRFKSFYGNIKKYALWGMGILGMIQVFFWGTGWFELQSTRPRVEKSVSGTSQYTAQERAGETSVAPVRLQSTCPVSFGTCRVMLTSSTDSVEVVLPRNRYTRFEGTNKRIPYEVAGKTEDGKTIVLQFDEKHLRQHFPVDITQLVFRNAEVPPGEILVIEMEFCRKVTKYCE